MTFNGGTHILRHSWQLGMKLFRLSRAEARQYWHERNQRWRDWCSNHRHGRCENPDYAPFSLVTRASRGPRQGRVVSSRHLCEACCLRWVKKQRRAA